MFALQVILDDTGVCVLFADVSYPGALAVERVLSMPGDYEDLIASADEADEVPLGDRWPRMILPPPWANK